MIDREASERINDVIDAGAPKQIDRKAAETDKAPHLGIDDAIVQAKLTVGPVDDPFEREADQIATRVVRSIAAAETERRDPPEAAAKVQRSSAPDFSGGDDETNGNRGKRSDDTTVDVGGRLRVRRSPGAAPPADRSTPAPGRRVQRATGAPMIRRHGGAQPAQGKVGSMVNALEKSDLSGRLQKEREGINRAKTFSEIADVIDGSRSPKKGEAAVKLRNTDKGVERARTFFRSASMDAEEAAFITSRYPGALSDQRRGIADQGKGNNLALAQILAKPKDEQDEADYSNLQWDATFGPNAKTTLKQELISPDDMKETVKVAAARGGLAKLVGLGGLWSSMAPKLQDLWTQAAGGDPKVAKQQWTQQTKAARELAIVPTNLGPLMDTDFAPYGSLDAAFPKGTSGCMGMGEDYKFATISDACNALGLKPEWYSDGAFVLAIPGGDVASATEAAKKAGGGVGKATVFTSLMFSEFNYIAEDRATNETESGDVAVNKNAKQNSGKKSAGGKTEVVVTNFQAADMFKQKPLFLG